jgi:hypothetical protein
MLVLALAVTIGFAALALLGGIGDRPGVKAGAEQETSLPRAHVGHPRPAAPPTAAELAGQDRQDRPGTAAHRRALEEVAAHRALQHVPWRAGGVSIELVGARRGRALLRVTAPTIGEARRGWRGFLRRFHDSGSAYVPRFEGGPRRG